MVPCREVPPQQRQASTEEADTSSSALNALCLHPKLKHGTELES